MNKSILMAGLVALVIVGCTTVSQEAKKVVTTYPDGIQTEEFNVNMHGRAYMQGAQEIAKSQGRITKTTGSIGAEGISQEANMGALVDSLGTFVEKTGSAMAKAQSGGLLGGGTVSGGPAIATLGVPADKVVSDSGITVNGRFYPGYTNVVYQWEGCPFDESKVTAKTLVLPGPVPPVPVKKDVVSGTSTNK